MITTFHGTTILAVRKNGRVALAGDGQVSIGDTIMKGHSVKVRALKGGRILIDAESRDLRPRDLEPVFCG